jgi:hypothetical protein
MRPPFAALVRHIPQQLPALHGEIGNAPMCVVSTVRHDISFHGAQPSFQRTRDFLVEILVIHHAEILPVSRPSVVGWTSQDVGLATEFLDLASNVVAQFQQAISRYIARTGSWERTPERTANENSYEHTTAQHHQWPTTHSDPLQHCKETRRIKALAKGYHGEL